MELATSDIESIFENHNCELMLVFVYRVAVVEASHD